MSTTRPLDFVNPVETITSIFASLGSPEKLNDIGTRLAAPENALTLQYLQKRKIDGLCFLPPMETSLYPRIGVYKTLWELQRTAIRELFSILANNKIKALLYKGAAITERFFSNCPFRFSGDIDVLVSRGDIPRVRTILLELGYVQGRLDIQNRDIQRYDQEALHAYESGHYNLRPFAKLAHFPLSDKESESVPGGWTKPVFIHKTASISAIVFDVSHGLDSHIGLDDFMERAVPSAFEDVMTLCDEDHLWYLCCAFYLNVFSFGSRMPLSKLAEIIVFVQSCKSTMDWQAMVSLATSFNSSVPLYYLLSYVQKLKGPVIPPDILNQLRPNPETLDQDFGWQLGKLFDTLEPFPETFAPPK